MGRQRNWPLLNHAAIQQKSIQMQMMTMMKAKLGKDNTRHYHFMLGLVVVEGV